MAVDASDSTITTTGLLLLKVREFHYSELKTKLQLLEA